VSGTQRVDRNNPPIALETTHNCDVAVGPAAGISRIEHGARGCTAAPLQAFVRHTRPQNPGNRSAEDRGTANIVHTRTVFSAPPCYQNTAVVVLKSVLGEGDREASAGSKGFMAFRFRCPKCETTSFSIERDGRSYAPRGQAHELIFSCRCGKQLFGEQIEKEYLRQKAAWEADASQRPDAPVPRPREIPVASPRATAPKRAPAPAPRRSESTLAAKAAPRASTPTAQPTSGGSCGWKDCGNPPRQNSKYCSRDCSNKNARHRYKRRKNSNGQAAA